MRLSYHRFQLPNPGRAYLLNALPNLPELKDRYLVLDDENRRLRTRIFINPIITVSANMSGSQIESAQRIQYQSLEMWGALKEIGKILCSNQIEHPCFAGYLGFEMLHGIERISPAAKTNYSIPDAIFSLYETVIEVEEGLAELTVYQQHLNDSALFDDQILSKLLKECSRPNDSQLGLVSLPDLSQLEPYSNFTQSGYQQKISYIIEQIHAGAVYQVNLSQQFIFPAQGLAPERLWRSWREVAKPLYGAYIPIPKSGATLISASPETFFTAKDRHILCSPIKGTRPRSENPKRDAELRAELLTSEKDHAELAMIVDLIRNDLNRVSKIASVKVEQVARLETLPHLFHLVSDVTAELAPDKNIIDLLLALFPCGSITGAPKVAAIKHIIECEQTARGPYTGAIGWIGAHSGEMSVAIRSAIMQRDRIIAHSGGGIVSDSEPESEYSETLAKIGGMVKAIQRCAK